MTDPAIPHHRLTPVPAHFAITVSSEHCPEIRGVDDGIWRKVVIVPAVFKRPDEETGGCSEC